MQDTAGAGAPGASGSPSLVSTSSALLSRESSGSLLSPTKGGRTLVYDLAWSRRFSNSVSNLSMMTVDSSASSLPSPAFTPRRGLASFRALSASDLTASRTARDEAGDAYSVVSMNSPCKADLAHLAPGGGDWFEMSGTLESWDEFDECAMGEGARQMEDAAVGCDGVAAGMPRLGAVAEAAAADRAGAAEVARQGDDSEVDESEVSGAVEHTRETAVAAVTDSTATAVAAEQRSAANDATAAVPTTAPSDGKANARKRSRRRRNKAAKQAAESSAIPKLPAAAATAACAAV